MTQLNYAKARQTLIQACKRYINHNKAQLSILTVESPIVPKFTFYERALRTEEPSSGFMEWVSCTYAYIFDEITELNKLFGSDSRYYESNYPLCKSKITFLDEPHPYYSKDVAPSLLLDRLNILVGLLNFIMIDQNKEPDFEQRWNDYKDPKENYDCLDNDLPSIQIYKTLIKLKSLLSFVESIPEYQPRSASLIRYLNNSLPIFERYRKGVAVQELEKVLNDATLTDENSIKAVALQLKNPVTAELLEKNHQSETEYMLKVLSVILVAVLIGVIPTLCLASKRLYDTGGSSINFFKPLSKNLCEDIENVTVHISPSNSQ